jgi:hypothetical protein
MESVIVKLYSNNENEIQNFLENFYDKANFENILDNNILKYAYEGMLKTGRVF